jgi:hypothetical protein
MINTYKDMKKAILISAVLLVICTVLLSAGCVQTTVPDSQTPTSVPPEVQTPASVPVQSGAILGEWYSTASMKVEGYDDCDKYNAELTFSDEEYASAGFWYYHLDEDGMNHMDVHGFDWTESPANTFNLVFTDKDEPVKLTAVLNEAGNTLTIKENNAVFTKTVPKWYDDFYAW